jgi:hypothetical protein
MHEVSINPHIAIVATAGSKAERGWLDELSAAFVCDALLRSIRAGL